MSILRITRKQYRQLAELAKQSGVGLSLDTFTNMGECWGLYSSWAQPIVRDAAADQHSYDERIVIRLATSINAAALRSATRPELDWASLEDDEIYSFILHHEIGHHVDNYRGWDLFEISDLEARNQCHRVLGRVNEMLADRYAWAQIRPGEPVPLGESGKRMEEVMQADLALLSKHMPRIRRKPRVLPGGQYTSIPASMLCSADLAAFVGPSVSPALIERQRIRRRDSRGRAR
ncbi:hypothetical protein [Pseudomonas sp. NBRC 111122]|uniref:hypothetical protein n=1 Tax=Pseudomonas sp. NBRC 111122 TaxID=1661037 RepID=UPI0008636EB7|nr:hypothetical protein [Pseudomonas sp. NBRC 111122]